MIVLGIESSCDETAASVVQETNGNIIVLSNVIASQAEIHSQYGGVVPEVAAREHVKNIIPVIDEAIRESGVARDDLNAIAVTQGPGLMVALHIGVETAKTLATAWNKPCVMVNHMAGHIYSTIHNIDDFTFPLIALLISGGHTQLVLMKKHCSYTIIGSTLDDAAGEAFDKIAKHLGLPYPGGPSIAMEAKQWNTQNLGTKVTFPRPMIASDDLNFSFSGLKTAVIYYTRDHPDYNRAEICAEFQQTVADVLIAKTLKAIEQYHAKTVIVGGGVASNQLLRAQLATKLKPQTQCQKINLRFPRENTSVDNAVMIGIAGIMQTQYTYPTHNWHHCIASPNLSLIKGINPRAELWTPVP